MQELVGKVGVVTGGGSGIGRAIAISLAAEGMRLAVLDIDVATAEEAAASIRGSGHEAKGAGVALSSSLRVELAEQGIGVSVLCPGMVRTQILDSGRIRQQRYGGPHVETRAGARAGRPA